jgi:hypothetical protein
MATPEGKIKNEVLDYLRRRGHWVLPHPTTAVYDSKIGQYRAFNPNNGTRGEPDLLVFSKSSPISPIWIELKTPRGRLSADQVLFRDRAQLWGHEHLVIRSVQDCVDAGL